MTDATGLAILFPQLDAATRAVRSALDPAYAQGLAPHVTILFPFLPETDVTAPIRARLTELFASKPAVEVRFAHLGRFREVLYLVPEPTAPFRHLTEAMMTAFPDHPPIEGAFSDIVPHLTLAQGPRLPNAGLPVLPLTATADAVSHLALRDSRWYEVARYPLAAPGARR